MEIESVIDQADPPPTLNTLPLEVRFKIFKELLINPVLGELKSILGNYQVQAPNDVIKYHLHPWILRVCRQNYEEGCEILYFQPFFLCYNRQLLNMGHPEVDKNTFTPLLRYGPSYRQKGLDCEEIKVITQPAFKKLDVILWDLAVPEYGEELMKPRQTFLPLKILRNVGNLTIREAALDEFPPPRINSRFSQRDSKLLLSYPDKSNLLDKKLYKKLKRLVEGIRPVERLSEMHRHLINFVLSFENFAPWKLDLRNYNRIVDASRVLVAAIEEDKDTDRALNLDPRGGYFQTFEAARLVILIEKYAAAFKRDQDERTEIAFRVNKREIKSFRMDHPREMMLRRLDRAFEHERCDLLKDAFKDLLCDLQAQFSEIKQTWRYLFKSDTHGNTMCRTEYDSDSDSLDGMIDLTV